MAAFIEGTAIDPLCRRHQHSRRDTGPEAPATVLVIDRSVENPTVMHAGICTLAFDTPKAGSRPPLTSVVHTRR